MAPRRPGEGLTSQGAGVWRSIKKNVAEAECGSAELSFNRVLSVLGELWLPGLWLWLPRTHPMHLFRAERLSGAIHIQDWRAGAQEKGEEP